MKSFITYENDKWNEQNIKTIVEPSAWEKVLENYRTVKAEDRIKYIKEEIDKISNSQINWNI